MADAQNDKAREVVDAIISDLTGRRGFGQTWDECDGGIQTEIWMSIYEKVLRLTDD